MKNTLAYYGRELWQSTFGQGTVCTETKFYELLILKHKLNPPYRNF